MYIDTHVHLNDPTIYPIIDEVINEAMNHNVKKFFVVGYNYESSKLALEIAKKYDMCYAIIGFHPTEIKEYSIDLYEWLAINATRGNKVVAIGECGYDLHWDTTTIEEQEIAFIKQIKIAIQNNLPLAIHSRDAIQKTYDTLKENHAEKVGGVMHSYSGSYDMAKEFIKLNFVLGISGPVTFKNGRLMKEVVEQIDIKYILTETDSPYLSPEPYRGKPNSPVNIPLIITKIAELKNMKVSEVEQKITDNVYRVFGV